MDFFMYTNPSSCKLEPHRIAQMHPCNTFAELLKLHEAVLATRQEIFTQLQQTLPRLIVEGITKSPSKLQLQDVACNG